MKKYFLGILIALSLLGGGGYLAFTTNSRYTPPKIVETVYASPGGEIFTFIEKYNKLDDKGEYLKIDGPCASACTFFLKLVEPSHVCATEKAQFLFHGVYDGYVGGFDPVMTKWVMDIVYPDFVKEILKTKGFDGTKDVNKETYPIGFIPLTAKELRINAC